MKPALEADRLRKTIALAEEAIREAAALRSAAHAPGETAEETTARWGDAYAVETAAKDCRKAARKALAALTVFADVRSAEQIAAAIEAARSAALALRDVCNVAQWNTANREITKAARDLAEQAEAAAARAKREQAAMEARRRDMLIQSAEQAERKKGGAL